MLINQENFYQNVVKSQVLNALHLSGNEGNTYINCICSNQKSEGSKDFSINTESGQYNCFAGSCNLDKSSGNCYDLVNYLNISINNNNSVTSKNYKYNYVSKYEYRDDIGKVVYGKLKYYEISNPTKKGFHHFIYNENGETIFSWDKDRYIKPDKNYPYNYNIIANKIKDKTLKAIVIIEGEKCCDLFTKFMGKEYPDIIPTTNYNGATKITKDEMIKLKEISVEIPKIIIRDNDSAGLKHQETIIKMSRRADFIVLDIESLGLLEGEDIGDYFQKNKNNTDELKKKINTLLNEYEPDESSYLDEISKLDSQSIHKRAVEFSETQYVNIFINLFKNKFIYSKDGKSGNWCFWNPYIGYWEEDHKNSIISNSTNEISKFIANELKLETNEKRIKKYDKFIKNLQNINTYTKVIKASSEREEFIYLKESFNSEINLIPCKNSITIDFKGKEPIIYESKPEDYFNRTISAEYDSNADCPNWMEFLNSCHDDSAVVDLLQEICGSMLIGDISHQKFFFMYGKGGNGKSIFLDTLSSFMDLFSSYGDSSLFEMTDGFNSNGYKDSKGRLKSARLVLAQEASYGKYLHEKNIKDLTGDDMIVGSLMYKDSFQFKPECTLILYGNYKPNLITISESIKRRLVIIPWNKTFSSKCPNYIPGNDLKNRFKREFSGILNWCLKGLERLKKNNMKFTIPEIVNNETVEYFSENDTVFQFISDCLIVYADPIEDQSREKLRNRPEFYNYYVNYCNKIKVKEIDKFRFKERMLEYKFEYDSKEYRILPYIEDGNIRGFSNIVLKQES